MTRKTSIVPMLSVRHGAKAVEFYKAAFGASERFRIDDPSGAVVAQLSVGEADFWVADESPEHSNFSPESLGGWLGPDGDDRARSGRRIRPGGGRGSHRRMAGQRSIRLAIGAGRRPVRASLGNRETARPRLLNSRPTSIWELVGSFTSQDSKMRLDSNHNLQ